MDGRSIRHCRRLSAGAARRPGRAAGGGGGGQAARGSRGDGSPSAQAAACQAEKARYSSGNATGAARPTGALIREESLAGLRRMSALHSTHAAQVHHKRYHLGSCQHPFLHLHRQRPRSRSPLKRSGLTRGLGARTCGGSQHRWRERRPAVLLRRWLRAPQPTRRRRGTSARGQLQLVCAPWTRWPVHS